MKASILMIIGLVSLLSMNNIKFDFGSDKDGRDWEILNDGVMGGLSKGKLELDKNSIKFTGKASLDNYGGFTSVKSHFGLYDLSGSSKVKIRYRTLGQSISLSLENNMKFYRAYFKLLLVDTEGDWTVNELYIKEFKQFNLGQASNEKISNAFLSGVKRIGFITSEKKEGDFMVEIDYLIFE
ncbi:MAG: CIA30 family protein [Bacteroidota bacterium]